MTGYSYVDDGTLHAFISCNGEMMMDLNKLIRDSSLARYVTLTQGVAINDDGWILANGFNSRTGTTDPFLLIPRRSSAAPGRC